LHLAHEEKEEGNHDEDRSPVDQVRQPGGAVGIPCAYFYSAGEELVYQSVVLRRGKGAKGLVVFQVPRDLTSGWRPGYGYLSYVASVHLSHEFAEAELPFFLLDSGRDVPEKDDD
jgi:hypothetical protein